MDCKAETPEFAGFASLEHVVSQGESPLDRLGDHCEHVAWERGSGTTSGDDGVDKALTRRAREA